MAFFQSKTLWVNQLADGVAELVLDRPGAIVNLIDAALLDDLEQALERIEAEPRFELLLVRSAKSGSFCHGLRLAFLSSLTAADEFIALARRGQSLCARLAQLKMPSVAVIAGSCLGAGLELAMACDYRIVLDRPAVQLGLTQLDLGLLPAWGGCQRLPRLIGVERCLSLLLGGRRLSAREAHLWGLADELVFDDDGRPPDFLSAPHKRNWNRFERRTWRQRSLESTSLGCRLLLRGAERVLRRRLPDAMPAPLEALAAVRLAVLAPRSQAGFEHECQALGRLGTSPAFHHLLWFHRQRERQRESLSRAASAEHPQQPALLGSGPTSLTLLYQAVSHGQLAVLRVADDQQLGMALLVLFKRLEGEARRGALSSAELNKALRAIRGTFTWTHFDTIDLALDLTGAADTSLLQEVARRSPDTALMVPGGPLQRVADLQQHVANPERVAAAHFVEPVGTTSLVEIARSPATSPENEARLFSWAASLGYTPVALADSPGRLVLRLLLPALNEAGILLRAGLSIGRIDAALRHFGFTHGPMQYFDLVGVDVAAALAELLQPACVGRLTFETGFALMVQRRWTGARAGTGFYKYAGSKRHMANAAAEEMWRLESEGSPAVSVPAMSAADQRRLVQERLIPLVVLEALRCVEEKVVADVETLDLALCLAYWPAHRGGPVRHARANLEQFTATCARLTQEHGPRYQLSPEAAALLRG